MLQDEDGNGNGGNHTNHEDRITNHDPQASSSQLLPEIKVNSDGSSNDDSFDSKNNFDISSCTEECSVNTTDTKINQETTEESNDESTNEYHQITPNHSNENNNHKDVPVASVSTEILIKVGEDNEDTTIDCEDTIKPKKSKRKRWKHYIFGMFVCFVITIIGGVYCYYNKPKFIIRF